MSLINHVYEIADQIVIVDSSDRQGFDFVKKEIAGRKLNKVELYHVLALGYPDPTRQYGLNKCRYDWVLYLDVDERINRELLTDISEMISKTKAQAFAIKRFEEVRTNEINGDSINKPFYTWQVRLYNRRHVTYRGTLHEQPIIDGTTLKLDHKYYMMHIVELRPYTNAPYNKLEVFDRLSYETLNNRLLGYASKMVVPDSGSIESKKRGKVLASALKLYQKLGRKRDEQEISDLDYFMLFTARDMVYAYKSRKLRRMLGVVPDRLAYLKRLRSWKSGKESSMMFEISNIIEKEGMIKYLKLDDNNIIAKLNRKYEWKKQGIEGIELLIMLLKKRYSGDYP